FFSGKLDGKRHRPAFVFPKLHGGTTESELFPRLDLRISYFFPPFFEFPHVHNVILNSQQRRRLNQASQAPSSSRRPKLAPVLSPLLFSFHASHSRSSAGLDQTTVPSSSTMSGLTRIMVCL